MIIGTGIDIVEIERIQKALEKSGFCGKVFAPAEIEYCEGRKAHRFASYAARFAAKEAFVKALGTGFRKGSFTDICVENDALGKPFITLSGPYIEIIRDRQIKSIHLSLSHSNKTAAAQVILEG